MGNKHKSKTESVSNNNHGPDSPPLCVTKHCKNIKPCVDQPRLVFVSLFGFFKTWKKCTFNELRSSLILVPLQQKWIYDINQFYSEIKKHLLDPCSIYIPHPSDPTEPQKNLEKKDTNLFQEFISILKWKNSQSLIFWMQDVIGIDKYSVNTHQQINKLVDPFWYSLSKKLQSLHDSNKNENYSAIIFEESWWKYMYKQENIKISSILAELYFVKKRWTTMAEIIHQSNPSSLKPIIFYKDENEINAFHESAELMEMDDNNYDCNENGIWYISTDYYSS